MIWEAVVFQGIRAWENDRLLLSENSICFWVTKSILELNMDYSCTTSGPGTVHIEVVNLGFGHLA